MPSFPFQFLADQLALYQPGGHIMPTTLLRASPPGFSDLVMALDTLFTTGEKDHVPVSCRNGAEGRSENPDGGGASRNVVGTV